MITLIGAFGIFAAVMLAVYGFLALLFDDREWIGGALLCGSVALIAVAGPALAAEPPNGLVPVYFEICPVATPAQCAERHEGLYLSRKMCGLTSNAWTRQHGPGIVTIRCKR